MYFYAQLNDSGVACSVTQHHLPVQGVRLIPLQSFDTSLLGKLYDEASGEWTAPQQSSPLNDPRMWWVDVGPFYDRFGPDALAIAASDHGACKAVQTLTGVRKYIDLRDPKVSDMIDMLIATGQPAAQPWAPGSGPMIAEKKALILEKPTTEYERHIKGLQQEG